MAKEKNQTHDTSREAVALGTSEKNLVKVSDTNVTILNHDLINDKIVIAKDEDGLYMTVKSNVDSGLLDSFKVYNRENYPVSQSINAQGETEYTVTCNDTKVII